MSPAIKFVVLDETSGRWLLDPKASSCHATVLPAFRRWLSEADPGAAKHFAAEAPLAP